MLFKEILIEKYETPSLKVDYGHTVEICWLDMRNNFHRYNGLPAIISLGASGEYAMQWLKNGVLHRNYDLPAIINCEIEYAYNWDNLTVEGAPVKTVKKRITTMFWYKNGVPYRNKNKPNVVDSLGTAMWVDENGRHHRVGGGPAMIKKDGTIGWYKHGKLYRLGDKPALIDASGALTFQGSDEVPMHVSSAKAWVYYGEQILKDRRRNGVKI